MTRQRWLYRSFLKQLTNFLLAFSLCLSLIGFLFICDTQRGIEDDFPGNKAALEDDIPGNIGFDQINALLRDVNQSSDFTNTNSVIVQDAGLEDNIFRSPFIVTDWEQSQVGHLDRFPALANRSSARGRLKTFAVVWPCKGSPIGCFVKTRYPIKTCRFASCQQTWALDQADFVVFYVYRIKQNEGVPRFIRPRHQKWVMLTPEAPARGTEFAMLDFPALKGQFNWTQNYRLDSDIPRVYGRLRRRPTRNVNYYQIYRSKTVAAAWFVSHCVTPGNRHAYVKRMQTVMDIHVYGSCGNYTCRDTSANKRTLDKEQCLPLLSKFYFFYLAFENSLCRDYVTEKFFKTFQNIDVIPVVRGGADYHRYFPPGTFIDASDFRSPEHLASFLLEVANDKNRYTAMLRAKNRYGLWPINSWFCDLCEKMSRDSADKSYSDLRAWFVKDQCHEPNDL